MEKSPLSLEVYSLDEVHGVVDGGLHQGLDVPPLLVGEVVGRAAGAHGAAAVGGRQLVVVLARAVRHEVGVVGGGGVGHGPGWEVRD